MSLRDESLQKVDSHWAVLAVGESERDRGLCVAGARLVKRAVGNLMAVDFASVSTDDDLMRRLSMAYEVAAIEGLSASLAGGSGDDDLRDQMTAGAYRAFELRRLLPLPDKAESRIHHVLHLSALAYCGDRWSDLRRWYGENDALIVVPSVADAQWDRRVLYRLFECWIRLFRKKRWDDLDRIREIIAGLRGDQAPHEAEVLSTGSDVHDRAAAFRLVALYNWAKATELLARYMLQGEPAGVGTLLDKHFEAGAAAAGASGDAQLDMLLRWLHGASRQMVSGSIWWVAAHVNSRVTKFVTEVTKQQALFELLPPQRAALQQQGLLDQAARAIVVDLPTSGGKTLLAQFRILQALNQFDREHGWVVYVAPTRALSAQITRRLRRDFEPIGVRVEQLTGAVEVDAFESELLSQPGESSSFDVLVATPEKLQLVIRNKKVPRPLALVVMDEAHNIGDESRGLRIELLLATIKGECGDRVNFLLLMPNVEKPENITRWLASDDSPGKTISIGTSPWKPNERLVGLFTSVEDASAKAGWRMVFDTLTTTPRTVHLGGTHSVGGAKPLSVPKSALTQGLKTAAMARVFSGRGTSIAVGGRIDSVWTMARQLAKDLPILSPPQDDIRLVQDFLKTEIGPDFELVGMLDHGVAVHHAGLSDEARALVEWLAEESKLRVLCATSTIAQGINFPVSSVFLASRFVPQERRSVEIPPRDFWNLAGRAGRINHDSVGIVGLAASKDPTKDMEYISRATGALVSRLVGLLDEVDKAGKLNNLEAVLQEEQWADFRCYVAHLWNEKKRIDAVLADTEQLLRNTLGYGMLRGSVAGRRQAERLLEATKAYAKRLAKNPGHAELADMTGFSPEGVAAALRGVGGLDRKMTAADWSPESLFGRGTGISELFGVMLDVPQLAGSLKELGGSGKEKRRIGEIALAWVNGEGIQTIAKEFFASDKGDNTDAITDACKAIYRSLVNAGPWGLSALSRLSGIDFESLSDAERKAINSLPAMVYHGVRTEEAVLMRMNSVPRTVAEGLGRAFKAGRGETGQAGSIREVRQFLKGLDADDWHRIRPSASYLSGGDFKRVWELLSGERR